MTIYGAGYRKLTYEQTSMWTRLWPIAWGEYRVLFRKKLGVLMFLLCLGPSLFNLGVLMLFMGVIQIGAGAETLDRMAEMNPRMSPSTIEFFFTPISEPPSFLVFLLLTASVSCRAIAKDRETRAMEIYWTRCIEPAGYFFAKWFGSFMLIGTVTVVAPLFVWIMGCVTAPDWGYLEHTITFVPRVLLALTIFTALLTTIAVMFSAVAATANLASILWLSLIAGSAAVGRALSRFFPGEHGFKAINPWDASKRVAEWVSGYPPAQPFSVGVAWFALFVIIGGLGVLASRRTRRLEAIG